MCTVCTFTPMTALQRWMTENEKDDAAVAAAVGSISRSQVSRLRRGESRPSLKTAEALEALTGLPAWEFLKSCDGAEARDAAA